MRTSGLSLAGTGRDRALRDLVQEGETCRDKNQASEHVRTSLDFELPIQSDTTHHSVLPRLVAALTRKTSSSRIAPVASGDPVERAGSKSRWEKSEQIVYGAQCRFHVSSPLVKTSSLMLKSNWCSECACSLRRTWSRRETGTWPRTETCVMPCIPPCCAILWCRYSDIEAGW